MGGFGRPFSFARRPLRKRDSSRQRWRLEPGDREPHHPRDQRIGIGKVADSARYGVQPAQVGDGVMHQRQREMQAPEDFRLGKTGQGAGEGRRRRVAGGLTSLSIRFRISGVPSVRTRPMN